MEMDAWFMRLGLVGLFGYFLWSMQRMLGKTRKATREAWRPH